ncbi:MAG: RNA polymerase sigma factor SigM [Actinomycetota bacterium]|nr:RNA polymerase sigma factor SigM [Actinomycetota bacterium]
MTADPRSDADLLGAHVAGDPLAFETLVRRHRDRLWAVALRTTGDPEEAADSLQDALISAYRRAEQFRGDSAVTTWLHRIVVNASLDRLRRRAVRAAAPLPDDNENLPGAVVADPVDHMDRRDTQLVVTAALAELPEDQRAAILLVDVEGWSVEDAARQLGIPEGTVKSRCHRGRARLAKSLDFLRNLDAADAVTPDAESNSRESSSSRSDQERGGGTGRE